MAPKRKKVLFVDDDANLLDILQRFMGQMSGGAWEICTALDVSKALGVLQEQKIDLLVLDIHMPIVDGLQFLNLLQRKYPNLLKVVLTGDATEHYRTKCLNSGAELFLEKPRDDGGWRSIHATLHELAKFQPEDGFQGVLRRVGLPDVLQMECLARHSVVLKVHAGGVQGMVYVKDGQIIHAQCGARVGEEAFNELMTLAGGEFDVQSFIEPLEQTITGSWEFLIMEAARRRDEARDPPPDAGHTDSAFSANAQPTAPERHTTPVVPVIEMASADAPEWPAVEHSASANGTTRPRVDELLVCTVQGEVLHDWQCPNPNGRVGFLEFLSQKSHQLSQGLALGEFDRLEVNGTSARLVARLDADRALLVRVSAVPVEGEAAPFGP
jgi:CheY-like chemotaxis protein